MPYHLSLSSTGLRESPNSIPVYSFMLSSHLFFCLPLLLALFTFPCRIVFAMPEDLEMWPYHLSFRFFTTVRRSSCTPTALWNLLWFSSFVAWSLQETECHLVCLGSLSSCLRTNLHFVPCGGCIWTVYQDASFVFLLCIYNNVIFKAEVGSKSSLMLTLPSWSSNASYMILSMKMLKRVGESRYPCRTPTVVLNQSSVLLFNNFQTGPCHTDFQWLAAFP